MVDWFVGQKVVCVDASGDLDGFIVSGSLRKGSIYTIRQLELWKGTLGVLLEEIRCIPYPGDSEECGFLIKRFRPVINPESDLSVFEAILRGVEKREVVEA